MKSDIFDHLEGFRDAVGNFGGGGVVRGFEAVGDVIEDREVREERVTLEDGVDGTFIWWQLVDAFAGHGDGTAVELFEAGDEAEERGFAGAAFAENGEKFAGGDGERNSAEDGARAVALDDLIDDEKRGRHCAPFTSFQISLYLSRRGTFCQK